jgi:hypothetical protein
MLLEVFAVDLEALSGGGFDIGLVGQGGGEDKTLVVVGVFAQ